MSYATVLAGLDARFATVSGIVKILDYAPTSVQDTPLLYSLLDSVEMEGELTAGYRTYHYRILHRLLFRWQDNEECEKELMPYVNAIVDAVEGDPQLGTPTPVGWAEIERVEGVWVTIAGIQYRGLDFYSHVIESS